MKQIKIIGLSVFTMLFIAACGGQSADQQDMAAEEETMEEAASEPMGPNAELIAEFNHSGDVLMATIEGMSGDQWTYHENPDRWNAAEVCEHIVMTEQALVQGFVAGLVAGEPNAEDTGMYDEQDAGVRAFIRDRSNPIQTSESLEPSGAYKSPDDCVAAFDSVRAKTLAFLDTTDVDFRMYVGSIAPGSLDDMDTYAWLLFAAGHVERHSAQIDQIKADPGYPAM